MRLLLALLFLTNLGFSQTLLRVDNMENPPTWRGVSTTGINSYFNGGLSSANDSPPNYPMYSSSDSCYVIRGLGLGSSTVEADTFVYPNVILKSGKQHQIRFKVASFGISPSTNTAAGVDQTDWIELQYSVNNGVSWWRDAQIQGISNASWSFDGAIGTNAQLNITRVGSFSTTTPTVYVSNAANPIVNVTVNLPLLTFTNLKLRFITQINATGETFMLDDVEVWDMTVPLPIDLLYFKAECKKEIYVSWSTLTETNNNYFTVYKSFDAVNWGEIKRVSGAGSTTEVHTYGFYDDECPGNVVYYKLTQTDYNGFTSEFRPIAIICYEQRKRIIKIINALGQEVDENYHGPKYYIYER